MLSWFLDSSSLAKPSSDNLKHTIFKHETPLYRTLKNVDMWMQDNKVINLRIALEKINGVTLQLGEVFSYWRLIGKPTKSKGYTDGMILNQGKFYPGTGGGLCQLLPECKKVLDIGCGHGEFTLQMAQYAPSIIGGDNSRELLKIANHLKEIKQKDNVEFRYLWTKGDFNIESESIDMIYNRRGPTSIVNHHHILKPGGRIIGIHSFDLDIDVFKDKLVNNHFVDITVEVFDQSTVIFDSELEFAKFLSASHMNPDYTLEANKEAFEKIVSIYKKDNYIIYPENRYIWQAFKRGHDEK